jgi:hypothetical protein
MKFNKIISALALFLCSLSLTAQVSANIQAGAKLAVSAANGSNPYNLTVVVQDDLGKFTLANFGVGDSVYLVDGSDLLIYVITAKTGNVLTVNDVNNTGISAPTGQGAIVKSTDNFKYPFYISGLRDDLRAMMMNRFAQMVDIDVNASKDITKYTGSGIPAFTPTASEPKLAQGLTPPYPFYAYNGTSWVLVSSGGTVDSSYYKLMTLSRANSTYVKSGNPKGFTTVNQGDTAKVINYNYPSLDLRTGATLGSDLISIDDGTGTKKINVDTVKNYVVRNTIEVWDSINIKDGGIAYSDLSENTKDTIKNFHTETLAIPKGIGLVQFGNSIITTSSTNPPSDSMHGVLLNNYIGGSILDYAIAGTQSMDGIASINSGNLPKTNARAVIWQHAANDMLTYNTNANEEESTIRQALLAVANAYYDSIYLSTSSAITKNGTWVNPNFTDGRTTGQRTTTAGDYIEFTVQARTPYVVVSVWTNTETENLTTPYANVVTVNIDGSLYQTFDISQLGNTSLTSKRTFTPILIKLKNTGLARTIRIINTSGGILAIDYAMTLKQNTISIPVICEGVTHLGNALGNSKVYAVLDAFNARYKMQIDSNFNKYGYPVIFVDPNSHSFDAEKDTKDYLHPDSRGQMKIFNAIKAKITVFQQAQLSAWNITGNTNTTSANFIGTDTNSDQPLFFKVYGTKAGQLSYNNSSTFFGVNSGANQPFEIVQNNNNTGYGASAVRGGVGSTAVRNTGIGVSALASVTTATNNIALGHNAGQLIATGIDNSFIGAFSGSNLTTGFYNIGIGTATLQVGNGNYNVAIGAQSQLLNTASSNVSIGYQALRYNTTGGSNTGIGDQSLNNNTTSVENTAIGASSLYRNTIGQRNAANGASALYSNVTGSYNTSIGYLSGYQSLSDNNIFIGYLSGYRIKTGSNNTIIATGLNTINSGALDSSINNTLLIAAGNSIRIYSDSTKNTGFNTLNPQYKVDINAITASIGNPIRLQGLQVGSITDSIVTSNSGVLKRNTINNILSSTTSSLRIPRLTTVQRDALNGGAGSAVGDVIYNTTTNTYQVGNSSAGWSNLLTTNNITATVTNPPTATTIPYTTDANRLFISTNVLVNSLTLTLPSGAQDGQTYTIHVVGQAFSSPAITNLAFTGGTINTASGTPTTIVSGDSLKYVYHAATSTWVRETL